MVKLFVIPTLVFMAEKTYLSLYVPPYANLRIYISGKLYAH
jgi:hypothetical protein